MKAAGIERELWPVLDANSQTLLPAIFGVNIVYKLYS
jgi:hypothetical protein